MYVGNMRLACYVGIVDERMKYCVAELRSEGWLVMIVYIGFRRGNYGLCAFLRYHVEYGILLQNCIHI